MKLTICSRDADEITQLLKSESWIEIAQASSNPDSIETSNVEVLLASPDLAAAIVPNCPKLKWVQSTWAGNTPLINLAKKNYVLTATKDIFGERMREYVFTYILYHTRNVEKMKQSEDWQAVMPNYLSGKTLGILGAGSIAKSIVPIAQAFELNTIGLNSSGESMDGYSEMYTLTDKCLFASQSDYVVNLLPDTPATRHVIDDSFINSLRAGSLLINAGRGSAIETNALLNGLEKNAPALAVLDVFEQEPLPKEHPLWTHEKVLITHHTASISDTTAVVQGFVENAKRYRDSLPLLNAVDIEKGY